MIALLFAVLATHERDLLVLALFVAMLAFGLWRGLKSERAWREYGDERRRQYDEEEAA